MSKQKYYEGMRLGVYNTLLTKRLDSQYGIFICHFCGKEFKARISGVALDNTTSCGCRYNLIGKRFGRLLVKDVLPEPTKGHMKQWVCQCDCGKQIIVQTGNLTNGHTQSCGCIRKDNCAEKSSKNMIGRRFGRLTVIKQSDETSGTSGIRWICQCDCGALTVVPTAKLNSGHTQSCGCLGSRGEEKIAQWLTNNNFKYQRQKQFHDCLSQKKQYPLKFDFYLPQQNMCIEFDGIQHFELIKHFGGEQGFITRKENDNIKNLYCNQNRIKLLRISYKDNIENKLSVNLLKEELNV